ncbi:Varicose-related protein [Linum grandiflorum]
MASAPSGNPYQQHPAADGGGSGLGSAGSGGFDINKLFSKPSSNPMTNMNVMPPPPQHQLQSAVSGGAGVSAVTANLGVSPSFPLPSSSPQYLTPSSSYPPPAGPYNPYQQHQFISPYPPPQPTAQLQQSHFLGNLQQQQQQQLHNRQPISSSYPSPASSIVPSPPFSPTPNPGGAVLMDILNGQTQQQHQQHHPGSGNLTLPFSSAGVSTVPTAPHVTLASPTQLPPGASPVRLLSTKLPKGRHLIGSQVVYDIDTRMQGEVQPQLECTPITKYASDPGLVLGRQIAVNRNYICYGLKPGSIRILNINTALRSLLRGHNQKVTDMAFFAEDVHLLASACVEGRIFIWKIDEGLDEEEKPKIFERITLALHIVGDGEPVHPSVCWHPHKQEILMVAIGNSVLKIDTIKVGKNGGFSGEKPLSCSISNLIDGVQFVGKHEGEVTGLSMCQWMTTRLASASSDGTVKIWDDRKSVPLSVLRPHDGRPVSSVSFLTASHRPDHIILITGGPLNQEVKVWASSSEDGWLLPSDSETWNCTQTLTLMSSAASLEDTFFNQAVALPRAGLFLLANAKKNAIYAVHIEYGPCPAATRMDYIAEFTVTMPILSLTGTSDSLLNGEHIVQVYCVQTTAIQQYALDLLQCLPPPIENVESEKSESNASRALDAVVSNASAATESSLGNKPIEISAGSTTSAQPPISSDVESTSVTSHHQNLGPSKDSNLPTLPSSGVEVKTTMAHSNAENISMLTPTPSSPRPSSKMSGLDNSSNSVDTGLHITDHADENPMAEYLLSHRPDMVKDNVAENSKLPENTRKGEKSIAQTDIAMVADPPVYKHPTHLVTPSEILSRAPSTDSALVSQGMSRGEPKVQDVIVSNDAESVEVVDVKVVEMGSKQNSGFDLNRESHITVPERKEKSFYSQASDLNLQMARDTEMESYAAVVARQANDDIVTKLPDKPANNTEDGERDSSKDSTQRVSEPETQAVQQSPSQVSKGKKQKGKNSQASALAATTSPFNSTDSSNEPGCSSGPHPNDASVSQISALQDTLDQLMNMQKEMQKQMNSMISVPVSKEGKRLEASLGRSVEKVVKANTDALWARFQEENAKREKLERERNQQLTNLMTNFINKDFPSALEKVLKKEVTAVGPAVARAISPVLEKTILSAIAESFQKGVGDKAVGQLERSVSSKLDTTVARQIQLQFQTSGKQALQDSLRSSLEASIIPAFEIACKAMFDKVDTTFQKGLASHISSAQQQFDSSHSSLAVALRDAINSASSITQTLSGELADGQRKILAFANSKAIQPSALSNGPLSSLHEMKEAPLDPTTELSRLIAEGKYDDAFTKALHRSDVSIVSWLCSQVDLKGILSMSPLPLSQGVVLALLQQLACDMINDTSKKVSWMADIAVAINPSDPMISMHVRPIFEQVYQILNHHRNLPTTAAGDVSNIRLLMYVINSVLMNCK